MKKSTIFRFYSYGSHQKMMAIGPRHYEKQFNVMLTYINKKITSLKRKYDELQTNTVLIHIGKCGGSTVRQEFSMKHITFIEKHLTRVKFNPSYEYIIVIRNPISRFISAFNWRYKLVVEDQLQKNRFKGEKTLLEKYQSANQLAESIYNSEGELVVDFQKENYYIHHLKEDIHYYIGPFLSQCNPAAIKAVLATETLSVDLKDYFNIEATVHEKENKNVQNEYLSELAYHNLRKYFARDFECIDTLYKMGLLSERKHELLSK